MNHIVATKNHIATHVAAHTKFSKADAAQAVDAVLDGIQRQLADGNAVEFRGFGKFERVETPARQGRNPRTGESIAIPAGHRIKFRPGKELKA